MNIVKFLLSFFFIFYFNFVFLKRESKLELKAYT